MIVDHNSVLPDLCYRYAASYEFFASQRNFSYALSQENPYLTRLSSAQASERTDP